MARRLITIHLPMPAEEVGNILLVMGTKFPDCYIKTNEAKEPEVWVDDDEIVGMGTE